MASTYSTNLGIELIGTGDQSGTWGATTNTNFGTLVEQAIVGYSTQAVTDSGVATVLLISNGASSTGRNYVIALTGALTAARTVEVPAVNKPYIFFNSTTGGFAVTVKVSGQTGVTIANGKKAIVYTNTTDVIEVANAPATEAGTQTLTNKTLTAPVIATIVNTGTLTLPTSTDTLVGRATTDTLTNKTLTSPLIGTVIGGTTASSSLTLQSTSGVGTTDSILLKVGNNGATTAMTVDSSGNVGIGTTTPQTKLVVSNSGAAGFEVNPTGIASSPALVSYNRSGAAYLQLTALALQHVWQNSGTEVMRIDSSGNVGIGTSSPAYKLSVNKGSAGVIANITDGVAQTLQVTTGSGYVGFLNPNYGAITFRDGSNGAENVRITDSGNVGIGTSSPADKLVVDGYAAAKSGLKLARGDNAYLNVAKFWDGTLTPNTGPRGFLLAIGNDSGNPLVFFTNDVERARIDSSGNVGIGTTSAFGKINVVGSADASYFETTSTTSTCSYWKVGGNTSAYYSLFQNASGSNIGWIRTTDGSTVQYYTGSDERLKENIKAAPAALSKIADLKVRSYNWKATGVRVDYGFIAQELVQTIPDAVSVGRDKEDGSIDVPWGVDYAKLVPVLVAAIQELSAKNDALEARLAKLENV